MACRSLCHAARPPALDTNYQPCSTAVTHAYRKLTLIRLFYSQVEVRRGVRIEGSHPAIALLAGSDANVFTNPLPVVDV
jgi:hypothetical protein